ncbi:MAG TPA: MBL fold metallo-hydrolase [Pyrinomonadaceae bacterium]|nr:MBL fold metallo-hydrolase [Pyrinomonadaceae bacterium]
MRIEQIEPDIYVLTGAHLDSNSTAIISDGEALLVDGMADRSDAEELRRFVEEELGKRVRFIICTHFFSDHLAALNSFKDASIIAHQNYDHTFDAEKFRTEEEKENFAEPDMLINDRLRMRWGRHELDIFYNPGHTMSTINIDIPLADLLLVGDNIVGRLVYLYYSTPKLAQTALERLRRRHRSRLIEGHQGLRDGETVNHALHYLDSLGKHVRRARLSTNGDEAIKEIGLDECLPAGIEGSDFEHVFHKRNLQTIIERGLFTAGSSSALTS